MTTTTTNVLNTNIDNLSNIEQQVKKLCLTEEDAKSRFNMLRNPNNTSKEDQEDNQDIIQYKLNLTLRRSKDKSLIKDSLNYDGVLEVSFNYYEDKQNKDNFNTSNTSDLFLNFFGYPLKLYINNKEEKIIYENQRIIIPSILLNSTSTNNGNNNTAKILFSCEYNRQGVGLHHYIDKQDNKEYTYSNFEPYDCHRLFPCFDQPNLKSQLKINVIAPNEWNVFTNTDEISSIQINNNTNNTNTNTKEMQDLNKEESDFLIYNNNLHNLNYKIKSFSKTCILSTYVYALCAGEYFIYENPNKDCKVKLRVIYRDSMKQYYTEEFFTVTMAGLSFYQSYFHTDYPFEKYDQIFCPEYNMGAMENVGLVTYNECYIWKESNPTLRKRANFAITILHELAHMWFGNLVTMNWWDDLWLNESFATFISHLCMDKCLSHIYTNNISWLLFNYWKGFAYKEDQASTTHPVMGVCESTDKTETNFDSITYEKGASILKQMYYCVGDEQFSKGLKNYFEKNKWKNAVYENFIYEMESVCPGIEVYAESWLKKAGLTSISISDIIKVDDTSYNVIIEQKACLENFNNLQTLLIDILVIYKDNTVNIVKKFKIDKNKNPNTNFNILSLSKEPSAILLNYNDWAYCKISIPNTFRTFFKENLYSFKEIDSLTKQTIYRCFFDMLRDAEISGIEYFSIVSNLILLEKEVDMVSPQLRYLSGCVVNYMPNILYTEYSSKLFDLAVLLIKNNSDNIEMLQTVFNQIAYFAIKDEHVNVLVDLLSNIDSNSSTTTNTTNILKLPNNNHIAYNKYYTIPQETRFSMLKRIYTNRSINIEIKEKLLNQECKFDNGSDESNLCRFYCKAALPNELSKEKAWNILVYDSKSEALPKMEELMMGFAEKTHQDLTKKYLTKELFEVLEDVCKKNDHFFIKYFIGNLDPCQFEDEKIANDLLDMSSKIQDNETAKKAILENIDFFKRKMKAVRLCEEYMKKNY